MEHFFWTMARILHKYYLAHCKLLFYHVAQDKTSNVLLCKLLVDAIIVPVGRTSSERTFAPELPFTRIQ